jgi:hypothetical protein
LPGPFLLTDFKYAPKVKHVDLTDFDRRPGCAIRIIPKDAVWFVKVTVRISDFFNRELAHGRAWDLNGTQEWVFTYFPDPKFAQVPGNLMITIRASEEPRKPPDPVVDPYELSPGELRRYIFPNQAIRA